MADPTFTAAPAVIPSRAAPSTFSALTDAFLVWEKTFRNELSSSVSWFSLAAIETAARADAAAASASEALASALSASAVSGAVAWVSAAPYTAFSSVIISPVNAQTYRAKTTHSGVTTDPSADATNWARLTFGGAYADLSGKPTLGTAAALNTGTVSGTIPILGVGGALPAVSGANLTNIPMGLPIATKITLTTGATSASFALPTGKGVILMEGRGITTASNTVLRLQVSTDGVTWADSSTDYDDATASTDTGIKLGNKNSTTHSFSIRINGANDAAAIFMASGIGATGITDQLQQIFGKRRAFSNITHVRFLAGANITGGSAFMSQLKDPA